MTFQGRFAQRIVDASKPATCIPVDALPGPRAHQAMSDAAELASLRRQLEASIRREEELRGRIRAALFSADLLGVSIAHGRTADARADLDAVRGELTGFAPDPQALHRATAGEES